MKRQNEIFIIFGALFGVLLFMTNTNVFEVAFNYLKNFEGFSPRPYWDVSRYSWGYGTQAPGPSGTITKERAKTDAIARMKSDYSYLSSLIKVPLSINQWAALLSFSYNLGRGNADNLVTNINKRDWAALQSQWMKYVNVNGVPDPAIIARRQREWNIFIS